MEPCTLKYRLTRRHCITCICSKKLCHVFEVLFQHDVSDVLILNKEINSKTISFLFLFATLRFFVCFKALITICNSVKKKNTTCTRI